MIPSDTVAAPCPPRLVIFSKVEPVAVPPFTTSLSAGEPSAPSTTFMAIVPLRPT